MDSDLPRMKTKAAIKHVASEFGIPSLYGMAKSLSDDYLKVQPIQISNYLNGTVMSEKVADKFEAVYGIYIEDAIRSGIFRNKPLPISNEPEGE